MNVHTMKQLVVGRLSYCVARQQQDANRDDWEGYWWWRSAIKQLHELLDDISAAERSTIEHISHHQPAWVETEAYTGPDRRQRAA